MLSNYRIQYMCDCKIIACERLGYIITNSNVAKVPKKIKPIVMQHQSVIQILAALDVEGEMLVEGAAAASSLSEGATSDDDLVADSEMQQPADTVKKRHYKKQNRARRYTRSCASPLLNLSLDLLTIVRHCMFPWF
jgi:hypothetical protein